MEEGRGGGVKSSDDMHTASSSSRNFEQRPVKESEGISGKALEESGAYKRITSNRRELEILLKDAGIPVDGTVFDMKERLLNHQNRVGFVSAVETMKNSVLKKVIKKQSKKQTRLEEDEARMKRAIDLIREQVDTDSASIDTELKNMMRVLLLLFSELKTYVNRPTCSRIQTATQRENAIHEPEVRGSTIRTAEHAELRRMRTFLSMFNAYISR